MTEIERALEWILSSDDNLSAFRADADAVLSRFSLSDDEKQIVRAVHERGLEAQELEDAGLAEVEAQRSYGWSRETGG